ncbi:MAG: TcpE family conjugal transfer membrane protein [Euzebya sp.]
MLQCRTYTHARRFPLVIGKVGGYALPTPLTPAQVVVLLGTITAELVTRHHWAVFPGPSDLVVAMILPVALAWAVRHATVEGRTPLRFAVGVLCYLIRPRRGLRGGRPVTADRPARITLRRPAGR